MVRVMIVDDHQLVREGMKGALGGSSGFVLCGEAATVEEAITVARATLPDIAIVDLNLPDGSGVEAIEEIRAVSHATRMLAITFMANKEAVVSSILAGACGFILKETAITDLMKAVEAVARGQGYVDPLVADVIFDRLREAARALAGDENGSDLSCLSAIQKRILNLSAEGRTNKQIAGELGLAPKTVSNYMTGIFAKLGVNRRSQAAAVLYRHDRNNRQEEGSPG